jgi:hypothetical protein
MKLHATALYITLMLVAGCTSNTAFEYSQAIVKIETDFAAEIVPADKKVSRYLDADQHDSASIITQQMEDLAEKRLEQVRNLKVPNVKEADNFRLAAIRYFTYLKTLYTSFNSFTKASSEQTREAERQRLAKIVADKDDATRSLQLAQRKFAAANHFRIEKAKQ